MRIQRCLLLLILLVSAVVQSFSQTDSISSPKSIYVGTGLGWHSTDNYFEGGGTYITLGYEHQKTDRLSFNYGLSYMWSNFNPGSDEFHEFNGYNLRVLAKYDLVQKSKFSVFGGLGPVWTRMRGVTFRFQLGNSPWSNLYETDRSFGIAMNLGLRFVPKPGKVGFEIVPFNAHLNFGQTKEFFFQFRFFKVF